MEIVVNEWLLDYMCPGTDSNKTFLAFQFIKGAAAKCDKIVVGRGTPFFSNFHRYMKKFGWHVGFKKRFRQLRSIFYNSDKTVIIDDTDIKKIPGEIEEKTPPDDKYLIELAYSSEDKIIVTTDKRLKEKLKDEAKLKIYLLEEFLEEYLS